jgi:two-component system CheB/CheR fusion protein
MSSSAADAPLDPLLDYLRNGRGIDLSGYRAPSLLRRVTKRMQELGIGSMPDYVDHLEVHPDEIPPLLDSILVSAASFFRDPEAWEGLAQQIIPAVIRSRPGGAPIRIWSAGCATGEEAFALAMLWAEALGVEAFRERVKIYATDIDEPALGTARLATYDEAQLATVPDELKSQYFERSGKRYAFRLDLRRAIVFGRHDLIHDAPISRLDLLVCRNTLIYLTSEVQSRILARFHFALNPAGYLFLGKSETLHNHPNLFSAVDLEHRMFSRAAQVDVKDRLLALAQTGDHEAARRLGRTVRLEEEALDTMPLAQIVLDPDGTLVVANQLARSIFALGPKDVGRRLSDLDLEHHAATLESLIERVKAGPGIVTGERIERRQADGTVHLLDVQAVPLLDQAGGLLGISILLEDISEASRLRAELERATLELETSNEELTATNEELMTTNEELQSTVEELETTNEELQSTNEEHETMNEELQATNEELHAVNQELTSRTHELAEASSMLDTVLDGLAAAVTVVDRDLTVLAWNRAAEDLWGLRSDETRGRSLMSLDVGLPFQTLREALRDCLNGTVRREFRVKAVTRRGTAIVCLVTLSPLAALDSVRGVIVTMESQPAPS